MNLTGRWIAVECPWGVIMKLTASLLCTAMSATIATPALAIIGHNSTATIATGGDSKYLAQDEQYSGVVGIMIDWGGENNLMTCSGFLLSDRRSIVTAGHCTSEGKGNKTPVSTTVYFDTGASSDASIFVDEVVGNVEIKVSDTTTHPEYTGSALDENDVAVLTLSELAPEWATSYEIYETEDLTGKTFTTAGYGLRNTTGGKDGIKTAEDVGVRRQGTNRYDYRMGDDALGDYETDGLKNRENLYVADFDDGTEAGDVNCEFTYNYASGDTGKYCDVGTEMEVVTTSGDSGTPQFVDGKVSSISSSGYNGANGHGSYGSTGNYVPLSIHTDFIKSAMIGAIPEPATWLQMLFGFGMLSGALRSMRNTAVSRIA